MFQTRSNPVNQTVPYLFQEVDGIMTSYFEGGSGEAMVLAHGDGFGSTVSANCWGPVFDHLSAHHVFQEYPLEITRLILAFIRRSRD